MNKQVWINRILNEWPEKKKMKIKGCPECKVNMQMK